MANSKAIISTAASLAASAMLIRSIANEFFPWEFHSFLSSCVKSLSHHFSSQLTIVIEEFKGFCLNQVFEASETYLCAILNPSVKNFIVSQDEKETGLVVGIASNEEVNDVFENVHFKWRLIATQILQPSMNRQQGIGDLNLSVRSEVRSFKLSFH